MPQTRILGVKNVKDAVQFFDGHHLFKHGEFDENLVPEELNVSEWRQYAIDYGIKTVGEMSYQLNKPEIYRRLTKLFKIVKTMKGYILEC